VTAERVFQLLATVKDFFSAAQRQGREVDINTRVNFRNAAQTLLNRARWLEPAARRSLEEFVNEQPKFLAAGNYKFTYDFFSRHIAQWRSSLAPLASLPSLSFLEVGSSEGRSACWLLENILTHDESRLTCIDVFREEQGQGLFDPVRLDGAHLSLEDRFNFNIEQTGAAHKVVKLVGPSQELLRTLALRSYDFIYIDGSHTAQDVLIDLVLGWQLLKSGGMMTIDDYEWSENPDPLLCPRLAVDAFLQIYQGDYMVCHQGYQVTLEKRRRGDTA
jgi:predicted O-methyltransferase YrrM